PWRAPPRRLAAPAQVDPWRRRYAPSLPGAAAAHAAPAAAAPPQRPRRVVAPLAARAGYLARGAPSRARAPPPALGHGSGRGRRHANPLARARAAVVATRRAILD